MSLESAKVPRGVIFNVQRASFHDGPGVRTTVFLKGCPLRCSWCHNPEGVAPRPQVIVNAARCLGCGSCAEACPRQDGPLGSGALLGSGDCLACGRCFDACPAEARQVVGREWTVAEVLTEVLRDRLGYDTSGGGVTFSGGEPLFQPAFLAACLEACRREGIHTAVDTCGFAPGEVAASIAARADMLLWDLKHLDPVRHRELTGVSLDPILANLEAASRLGLRIWLRIPVIPGVNDDEANLRAAATLASRLTAVERVSLLPYHRTGTGKAARLGTENGLEAVAQPSPERMRALASVFADGGVEAVIGG